MTEDEFIQQGVIRLMPEPTEERMEAALARVREVAAYLKAQGVRFDDRSLPRIARPEREAQSGWDGLPKPAVAYALSHPAYRDARRAEQKTPEQEREEAKQDYAHWKKMARLRPDDKATQATLEKAKARWEAWAGVTA